MRIFGALDFKPPQIMKKLKAAIAQLNRFCKGENW